MKLAVGVMAVVINIIEMAANSLIENEIGYLA